MDDPPEPFAGALRDGWTEEARAQLAGEAEDYARRHRSWLDQIAGAGMDLVDARQSCKVGLDGRQGREKRRWKEGFRSTPAAVPGQGMGPQPQDPVLVEGARAGVP